MKIQQRDTAIDNYHQNVKQVIYSQNKKVLDLMEKGTDYSLRELKRIYSLCFNDIDVSTISRIVNSLHKEGVVEYGEKRPCTISGVTISPTRKVNHDYFKNTQY